MQFTGLIVGKSELISIDGDKVTETGFGPRYLIEGELRAPDGRTPHVCTVWQLDKGQLAPRLITAYPLKS
jgi:hypothetical protein